MEPTTVLELRQYTLHPGRRDDLIGLFEREFIEMQEAQGLRVLGTFRDLDREDRFVWLRGFADMDARARGLAAFYGGPVWAAHREEANATMIDSDDVRLLRPAWPEAALDWRPSGRAVPGAAAMPRGLLAAWVLPLRVPAGDELLRWCQAHATPALQAARAHVLGWAVTEPAANNFPRLPVREGEPVLAGFALFDDAAALDRFVASPAWARELEPALARWAAGPMQRLRLAPTARSAIHL
jgi:NIPSNAP